jgi:hypothetical protein
MNTDSLIESIRLAVSDGADDAARAAGANACRALLAILAPQPTEPAAPPPPPSLPIAAIAQAIRSVPRDQLADLLIAKLRTLVPEGPQAAAAHKFNIPLVKVPTP